MPPAPTQMHVYTPRHTQLLTNQFERYMDTMWDPRTQSRRAQTRMHSDGVNSSVSDSTKWRFTITRVWGGKGSWLNDVSGNERWHVSLAHKKGQSGAARTGQSLSHASHSHRVTWTFKEAEYLNKRYIHSMKTCFTWPRESSHIKEEFLNSPLQFYSHTIAALSCNKILKWLWILLDRGFMHLKRFNRKISGLQLHCGKMRLEFL